MVLNVTETGATEAGDLVVLPVLNGKVDLYNSSSGPVNLTADVQGYYARGGAALLPVPTVRAMDTRSGLGRAGGAVVPHAAASLDRHVHTP